MSFTELDAWLRARAAADEFSGVVLIRRGERTEFSGAYGWASRRWPVPMTESLRFDTASITKLFTSVAALRLADQGKLDVDTPITEIVDLAGTTISPAVTVRQLLTHSSGIADDADEEAGESYEALWVDKPVYSVTEARDYLPQFACKPPNFPPGQGVRYCNVGFILVGLAIEELTGTPYRDHIRADVFARAGMTSSDFYDRREATQDVAEGWDRVFNADGKRTGWKQNIFSYPPIGSASDGAHVTAEDLVRFLRAIRGGELLSPERTELFLTPQVRHETEGWYGFGLEFTLEDDGTIWAYSKGGGNTGVSTMVRHYPATDLDVVMLSNAERGGFAVVQEIDQLVRASV